MKTLNTLNPLNMLNTLNPLNTVNGPDLFDGTHPEARDPKALDGLMKSLDVLSKFYFRTEVYGMDNVPEHSALLVGTHIGGLCATDMFLFFHAWHRRFGDDKPLYGLGHDMHFVNPLTRELFARGGAVKANREMAHKVLGLDNAYLAVYPTGARELFKPYHRRNEVNFHGHKGFVKVALEAQRPIVPVVSTGADTFVCLNEGARTARLLGLDKLLRMPVWPIMVSFPLGVTFGPAPHLPLPSQVRISVGQPIQMPYGPEAAKDPEKVDALYRHVESTMQSMTHRLSNMKAVKPRALPSLSEMRASVQAMLGYAEAMQDQLSQLAQERKAA
ncbi:MAG: 1-acyl-sn-glycerol-3-phosphate acyltransferase [Myxococcota bacterium]